MDEAVVWEKLISLLEGGALPKREIYEIPLPLLGYLLWPGEDSNSLKYYNRLLAKTLRSRGIKIIRKHGIRYAQIPRDKIVKKKPEKLMVAEAWKWP